MLGIPYKQIQGSEVRSEGSAAEDRLPLMPHEGTLCRKATGEPLPLCLGAGRTGLQLSSGIAWRSAGQRVGKDNPALCAPQDLSAGIFVSIECVSKFTRMHFRHLFMHFCVFKP